MKRGHYFSAKLLIKFVGFLGTNQRKKEKLRIYERKKKTLANFSSSDVWNTNTVCNIIDKEPIQRPIVKVWAQGLQKFDWCYMARAEEKQTLENWTRVAIPSVI